MIFVFYIISFFIYEPNLQKVDTLTKPFYTNQKIAEYKTKKEFEYERKKFQGNSIYQLLSMLNYYINYYLGKFLSEYLIYIMIILAIIFFILQSSGLKINSFFKKTSNIKKKIAYSIEDLTGLDLEKAYQDAIIAKNYNLAMRYLYLKAIENLASGNLIKHNPSKTNKDYLSEIKSLPFSKEFKHLTLYFDYVCYGDFNLDETEFSLAIKSYDNLRAQIIQVKK